jgi:NAD-dependent deacetylase
VTVDRLTELAQRIASAQRLTILTGAGVSAASGVPTFRGADGLWRQHRPEDLATAEAFRRDPVLVWEWYAWRRETIAGCTPNAAHEVIAQWSDRDGCRVVTQNVDDLHLRAGTRNLVRLHGSVWEVSCWNKCGQLKWRDDTSGWSASHDRRHLCPSCGVLARPAVVWFGESLDPADISAALAACDCDVFLTVGTSAVVYPAAGFVHEAARRGAFTAEVNLDATPASEQVDLVLHGPAEQILPQLAMRRP